MDVLAGDIDAVSAILEAGEALQWWPSDVARWRRIWGRVRIGGAEGYCTLLYETAEDPHYLCTVELLDARPETHPSHQYSVPHEALDWIRVSRFPSDMRLPTVQRVLNDTIDPRIVRYIPNKRCTLSGKRAAGEQERFIKVFPDSRGRVTHDESLLIWQAATAGDLDFDVARPIGWAEDTKALWQGKVACDPLKARLKTEQGPSLALRIGKAAGSIPPSRLLPQQTYDASAQFERTRRYANDLCARFPHLADDVNTFLDELGALHEKAGRRDMRPLHGSPHVKQWLYTDARLGLVDFDRVSMGHPELDAATFVADIDYEDPETYPVEELNGAFLEGYQSMAGSLDMDLFQACRAHKHFAKAVRAARAVRQQAGKRAKRNLRRAMLCLKQDR